MFGTEVLKTVLRILTIFGDGVEHVFLRQFLRVQHAGMILRVQHPLALNKGY